VRFDQIWFRYARRAPWTPSAVDATVQPGQTVVVLGRNGAGKSTLLQLAAGVLEPTRGAGVPERSTTRL
jgi:ABC-2 type transport system ATP-binding protein